MSAADWMSIRDSGFEWGKNNNMNFSEFLRLGYEDQVKYLKDAEKQLQKNLIATKEIAIVEAEAGAKALENEYYQMLMSKEYTREQQDQKYEEW
jgi:hypothetical protein